MSTFNPADYEAKWQKFWVDFKTFKTNDSDFSRPKYYVLDMFPYPSGAGLHVGHPEGYTATDILARYKRMKGFNVLHPIGWDAFGLPAEQYAIKTGTHPRVTTVNNIARFRQQLQAIGFSYDWDREVDTTDPDYYRWTQWIFLKLYEKGLAYESNALVNWCPELGTVLANEEVIEGKSEVGGHPVFRVPMRQWMLKITAYAERLLTDLDDVDWPESIKEMQRNWIGKSIGAEIDFEVASETVEFVNEDYYKFFSAFIKLSEDEKEIAVKALTENEAYGGFLTSDLNDLMNKRFPKLEHKQRNFIRKQLKRPKYLVAQKAVLLKEGAAPKVEDHVIRVFTTRPDTLFGATYMVLSPEHPLVDKITTKGWKAAVEEYKLTASRKSDLERSELSKKKTGVFTGAYAVNPATGKPIPVWIADYVLMGYGTGAIMAVPGHDTRDWEFADQFGLPIVEVVSGGNVAHEAYTDNEKGVLVNSANAEISLDGLTVPEAKTAIIEWLEKAEIGKKQVNYKLRDWLFSRQRYWGEPFPVIHVDGKPKPLGFDQLPVNLPELEDYKPTGEGKPPLARATEWLKTTDPETGKPALRETNTMPQWAGSCWYYLRYIDPNYKLGPVDPEKEKYWMPVDMYVGGAEHAVLHLLYARFWHKVLFDCGVVSTREPFRRLVNQGMILGEMEFTAFKNAAGTWISPAEAESMENAVRVKVAEADLEKKGESFVLKGTDIKVDARSYKMSKSRGNVINPDDVISQYGSDALRLYEMFMGPLEQVKPWSMRGVEGVYRFLGRIWRLFVNEQTGELSAAFTSEAPNRDQLKSLHEAIKKVTEDIEALRFNTAISAMMIFVNDAYKWEKLPKSVIETFLVLLQPFAPHIAEEMWSRLGHTESISTQTWPEFDASLLTAASFTYAIQVNGKMRGELVVASSDAENKEMVLREAKNVEAVKRHIEGKPLVKEIFVPKKIVNIVVAG